MPARWPYLLWRIGAAASTGSEDRSWQSPNSWLVEESGHEHHHCLDHSPEFAEERCVMPIAGGVALLTIGAILTFAVTGSIRSIDLHAVGTILMAAGAAVLLLPLVMRGMSPPKRWSARSRQDAIDEADDRRRNSAAPHHDSPPYTDGPTRQDRARPRRSRR
ncbi:hypothetical protein ETD83_27890 [Actinomadura soli]|uniref:DUF6458 domain-containing protein n=1 Tax=Actinomadura soli TaxID=2508997 RepID=A0A5C4J5J3_9ACTN|nr:DUF6458 family protein [Actinomadura soli]TMQ92170.1 hypothetical protein ETD83_27890 [Actinomadura soli]